MDEIKAIIDQLASGDFEAASAGLAGMAHEGTLDALAYQHLAEALVRQDHHQLCRDLLEGALGQWPQARELHRLLIDACTRLGDEAGAIAAVERLVLLDEDDAAPWIELSSLRQGVGDLDLAIRAAQHAIRCDDTWSTWQRLAVLQEQNEDSRTAAVAYRNALRSGGDWSCRYGLAMVLVDRQDQIDEVVDLLRETAADPNSPPRVAMALTTQLVRADRQVEAAQVVRELLAEDDLNDDMRRQAEQLLAGLE
jgi:tetratricopeptide (TPR) repeat protein